MRTPWTLALLALLGSNLSCGSEDAAMGPGPNLDDGPNTLTEDLQLTESSVVVDVGLRDTALLESDLQADRYVWDLSELEAAGVDIEVDDVLLVGELALIRVEETTVNGSELVVTGRDATLNELVTDGQLTWDLALDGTPEMEAKVFLGDLELERKDGLADQVMYSTEVDGFSVSVQVRPDSGIRQLEVEIVVSRTTSGGEFRAVAQGTVGYFRHGLNYEVQGGDVVQFASSVERLGFDIEVLVAGANAETASTTLVLPGPFRIVVPIPTALPLGLNVAITFNLLADVQLPSLLSASTTFEGRFRVGGASSGFSGDASGLSPDEGSGTPDVEVSEPNTAGSMGGVGFTFALAAPRIIFNALGDSASVRFDNIYTAAGSLLGTVLSGLCVEVGGQHSLRGNATASFFGLEIGELGHTFFEESLFDSRGSNCP
ncbi:MAG: hypothetical protein AAGD10_02400 [Myxococcota bacterium]